LTRSTRPVRSARRCPPHAARSILDNPSASPHANQRRIISGSPGAPLD
jgi:hypothetical protein